MLLPPAGAFKLLGRLSDLRRLDPESRFDRLDVNPARWTLAINRSWLEEGIRRGHPFLILSRRAGAGTVFEWEWRHLRLAGYRRFGRWLLHDGMSSAPTIDLGWIPLPDEHLSMLRAVVERARAAQAAGRDGGDWNDVIAGVLAGIEESDAAVRSRFPGLGRSFEPKAGHELQPFLALSPWVLGLPFPAPVPGWLLLALRALPLHILGVTREPAWADGRWCSPAEYFFHDLDHARFKIREDLLALGYDCPDAYQSAAGEPPSTLDASTGLHRGFLHVVRGLIREAGAQLWRRAPERLALARRVMDCLSSLRSRDQTLADAAELVLLEIVHEKSFPMDSAVVSRELGNGAHVQKLRRKCASGFYGSEGPGGEVTGRFDEARAWLAARMAATG